MRPKWTCRPTSGLFKWAHHVEEHLLSCLPGGGLDGPAHAAVRSLGSQTLVPSVSVAEGNCVKVCCIWLFSHPPGFHRQRIQLWYNNLTPLKRPDPVAWQPLLCFMFPYILKAVKNYGQQHLNCTFIHFGLWPLPISFNLPYPPAFPMGDLTYTLW